jgi:hypothetical protein
MRAAELAAGYIFSLLNDLLDIVNSSLLQDPLVACLDAENKSTILREFASIRRHICFTFSVKLAFWNQNPWILSGLAHSDCGIARSCCRRAVAMADSVVDWAKQHPITQALLKPGSRGRQMLQEFINGRDLQSLPKLETYAAMFRFIRVTERWIEAVHAINKKVFALAHNAGAVHLCFHLELRQLRKQLESQDDVLDRMAAILHRAGRSHRSMLLRVGFLDHPAVKALLGRESGQRALAKGKRETALTHIMYHTDVQTLMQRFQSERAIPLGKASNVWLDLGDAGGSGDDGAAALCSPARLGDEEVEPLYSPTSPGGNNSPACAGSADEVEPVYSPTSPGGNNSPAAVDADAFDVTDVLPSSDMPAIFGGRLHDVLWRDCALRFVQSLGKGWIADGVGMASKVIMVKSNGTSCTSVLDAVQMDLTLENRSNVVFAFGPEQGVLEVPVDKQAPSVDPGSHNVLFASLLRTVPKDMKVLKGSKKVTDDSAAIVISQLHPVELRKTGDRSGVVRLSLERQGIGDREALVLTANTFETESLWNMLCWDVAPINHYDFGRFVPEDLRTAMPPVMAGLIDSLGDEDSCYRADEDALTVLRYLESMGFVARLPEHRGSNSWRITREGLASLNVSTWLSNPVRIFKARADVEDSELQCLEVHFRLAEAGWVCQVGQKAAKPTPYIKGGPKVLWLQTGQMSFCQPYLLCLLKVMEGSLDKEVPHFQQVKVYNSLL